MQTTLETMRSPIIFAAMQAIERGFLEEPFNAGDVVRAFPPNPRTGKRRTAREMGGNLTHLCAKGYLTRSRDGGYYISDQAKAARIDVPLPRRIIIPRKD